LIVLELFRYIWKSLGGEEKMSKRLEAMAANPRSNWTIADVEALCSEFGVSCAPPTGGGSHYKIAHPSLREKLTIPFKRPIKPVYIKKLVAFVKALRMPP
jgi:hypothetical protein